MSGVMAETLPGAHSTHKNEQNKFGGEQEWPAIWLTSGPRRNRAALA